MGTLFLVEKFRKSGSTGLVARFLRFLKFDKNHRFFVSNSPYYKKKMSEKTTFFQITHEWLESDFCDFPKKSIFFRFFLFKFTLLSKKNFCENFGGRKWALPLRIKLFWNFTFFSKKVFSIVKRQFFFVFFFAWTQDFKGRKGGGVKVSIF